MKKLFLLLGFALISATLTAQRGSQYNNAQVKFCTDLDSKQYPQNPGSLFYISPQGSWVYVWVGNDRSLNTGGLKMDVYKKSGDDYTEFIESKSYDITPSWEDTHFKYSFYKEGDYKVSIFNKEGTWIANGFVTIKVSEDLGNKNNDDKYNDPNSTFYYINSKVQFCVDLDDNQMPVKPGTSYIISKKGSWIYVHVQNDKPLATNQLIVRVYKKKGKDYKELTATKYYDIKPEWEDTHFKYTFYKSGDYKVSVSSRNDVWINSGYVKISYK